MRSGFGNISSAWSILPWVITMFFNLRTAYHSFQGSSHDLRRNLKLSNLELIQQKQNKQSIDYSVTKHLTTLFYDASILEMEHSDEILRWTSEGEVIRGGNDFASWNFCKEANEMWRFHLFIVLCWYNFETYILKVIGRWAYGLNERNKYLWLKEVGSLNP